MKKPATKLRQEIAKLQDRLREAETREAERIGRIALKAGLADLDIDEPQLLAAFEDVGRTFRGDGRIRAAMRNGNNGVQADETPAIPASQMASATSEG